MKLPTTQESEVVAALQEIPPCEYERSLKNEARDIIGGIVKCPTEDALEILEQLLASGRIKAETVSAGGELVGRITESRLRWVANPLSQARDDARSNCPKRFHQSPNA